MLVRTLQVSHGSRCEGATSIREGLQAGVLRQPALVQILALDKCNFQSIGNWRCF